MPIIRFSDHYKGPRREEPKNKGDSPAGAEHLNLTPKDMSEPAVLAKLTEGSRGKPSKEVREAVSFLGRLEDDMTALEMESLAGKIGTERVRLLMNLMRQVPGIDGKAFTLQKDRGMQDWPQDDVLNALRTEPETKVRAYPVYYFALFRTALNNERKATDALTAAMAGLMGVFGKENYLAMMDCLGEDPAMIERGETIRRKGVLGKLSQEHLLERLKKAKPQQVKKHPDLYYAIFTQAAEYQKGKYDKRR
ncbi:MAG: hypothetical protein PHG85_03350 [Candidatus Altiarchaeota archaeon]|nr:hypothetical protein [Candidatus Altiarchaeota archaeon]